MAPFFNGKTPNACVIYGIQGGVKCCIYATLNQQLNDLVNVLLILSQTFRDYVRFVHCRYGGIQGQVRSQA